ncbi:hydantoinase/oxoprolinase family protein [Parahaliea aestuarii]
MYDLDMDPVEPLFLAPRRRSLEVKERTDVSGNIITPLDEQSLRSAAKCLVEEHDVEVFVICYLHAYVNPENERRSRDILAQMYPDIPVSISSDVLPRKREYRRLVVTGFDGYVKPAVTDYLTKLSTSLQESGINAPFHIMQSHGGVGGVPNIVERPVRTVLSGLAAGVIGAANVGRSSGHPNCISFDMGGTSTDVALISDGKPIITSNGSFEDYPLNIPMVDVRTIGAGGSSIAYVDEGGALKVGPESAGAVPGPVCYGRGGTRPTVTDASLVLGYLNPESFAGDLNIDREKSFKAIEEQIAKPLGMDTLEAALGIHAIVNSNMAQTLRLVSIKRGFDPRDFTLIPFGGAGPLQGGRCAEFASIRKILVPPAPGVLSAMGLMLAPIQHESMVSYEATASDTSVDSLREALAQLDSQNSARMSADGVDTSDVIMEYYAEMRYVGQAHELEIPIGSELGPSCINHLIQLFHETHHQTYNHSDPAAPVELVSLRSVHLSNAQEQALLGEDAGTAKETPEPTYRRMCFDKSIGFEDTPVYSRATLPTGFSLIGPAIIEQLDTTTLIYRNHRASVDVYGNIIIDVPDTE